MSRHTAVGLLMALIVLSLTDSAHSAVQMYTGRMEVLVTSGKSCEGLGGSHNVTLVLKEEAGATAYGYFVGNDVTIGKFSGSDLSRLDVHYPFHDEQRAGGHTISLSRVDGRLVAELHDRHVEATADDCNFDLARLDLSRSVEGNAEARLTQIAGQFEAQMTRSHALYLLQKNGYAAAVPQFEKALVLADTYLEKGSDEITPYLVGLATSYIWLDRLDDFNRLFDARIIAIQDTSVRSIFSGYRVRNLLNDGRTALGREEYEPALKAFEQAYTLQPQDRDVIAAIMAVYVRSSRYVEAVSFLERAERTLIREADRADVRGATALVLFKKSQKDDKAGNGADAEAALKRAMKLDPGSVYYLIALARLRHKAGSLADADRLLDQGMEQFKDIHAQNELSAARAKIHQTELFLKKLRQAGS